MHESEEAAKQAWGPLGEATLVAAAMCLFALFVRSPLPLGLLSALGLLATALALCHGFRAGSSPLRLLALWPFSRRAAAFVALGALIGVGLGVAYRWHYGASLLPSALGPFALVGALIGATEELLYRGYVQGRVRGLRWLGAPVFAALCHTAYKCSLFALPPAATETDFVFLAAATFLVGTGFGALRALSRSVYPPLLAHALFDIIVYGGLAQAPWWVWA